MIRALNSSRSRSVGQVFLIGAGPGDPDLLTLKGQAILRQADAIVYDYLVNPRLLEESRPDARLIYVGKQAGRHTMSQSEINRQLIELAGAGLVVARLKGGDPFVFGRGGEECQALQEAGIAFEVVPGISSPVAVAAYAGIPLTHRGFTSSFTVITGHEDPSRDGKDEDSRLDWPALARVGGTLVFLMGVGRLAQITARLVEAGLSPRTPVAVIEWGTTWQQRTVTGDLTTIAELSREAAIKPPAITVVGEVVGLRDQLQWFDQPSRRPLLGQQIVISHTGPHSNAQTVARLSELGAGVIEFPVSRVGAPASFEALDGAISHLTDFDWLVFSDAQAVDYFWRRLWAARLDSRRLAHLRLVAATGGAATALEERGLIPDLVVGPTNPLHRLKDLAGAKILLPCAEGDGATAAPGWCALGATVTAPPAYRLTLEEGATGAARLVAQLESGQIAGVSFGSAQAVADFETSLATVTDRPLASLLAGLPVLATGSAGPLLRSYGLPDLSVYSPGDDHLLEALWQNLSPHPAQQVGEG